MDGEGTKCRRSIAENFNRLSIGCTSVTDDRWTDGRGRATAHSERELESLTSAHPLSNLGYLLQFEV